MPEKDKAPPPPKPLRTFLNLGAAQPTFEFDPTKPTRRVTHTPTAAQLRAQALMMGLADLVRGATGVGDQGPAGPTWTNAGQVLSAVPLGALGAIKGGLKIVGQADDVARGLYSRVDEALKLIPTKGAHPNKVKSLLQSNASAEELAYRQVPEFLAGKGNATVTPAELAAHLAAHPAPMPQVHTRGAVPQSVIAQQDDLGARTAAAFDKAFPSATTHGQPWPGARLSQLEDMNARHWAWQAAGGDTEAMTKLNRLPISEEHRAAILDYGRLANETRVLNESRLSAHPPTKYSQYQVPGGENYRETLSTLPTSPAPPRKNATDIARDMGYGPDDPLPLHVRDEIQREIDASVAVSEAQRGFRSGHWDEPNVLVHTRSNERTLPTGEPGRFVEEVQSDWHQTGKEEGYRPATPETGPVTVEAQDVVLQEGSHSWMALAPDGRKVEIGKGTVDDAAAAQLYAERYFNNQASEIRDARRLNQAGQVPDAPFKESWPDLGLKQQVLEAADDPNAQWLGFTGGETQAARYDLSKKFSAIHLSGTNLKAYDLDGNTVVNQTGVTADNLKKYLGRAGARALLAQPQQGTLRSLVGDELNFGGEGMRHFYDNLLPKRLEKILKPFGGTVEQAPLSARTRTQIDAEMDAVAAQLDRPAPGQNFERLTARYNALQAERNTAVDEPAWIARLTPEMKERIRREGLPLLSLLGAGYLWQAPNERPEYRQ